MHLALDARAGLPKGWARIDFRRQRDAEEALSFMDGGQLDGNTLRVSFALVRRRDSGAARGRSRSRSRSRTRRSGGDVAGNGAAPREGGVDRGLTAGVPEASSGALATRSRSSSRGKDAHVQPEGDKAA